MALSYPARPAAPPPELPPLDYLALTGQAKTAAVRAARADVVGRLLEDARQRGDRVMFPEWLRAQVRLGALVVVSHSGGKDSQALLLRILEVVPPNQILVVHADLHEVEWPGTMEAARAHAEKYGLPFIVARARDDEGRDKSFYDAVRGRKRAIARIARELMEEAAQAKREGRAADAAELVERARKKAAQPAIPGMTEQQRYCTSDLKVGPIQREAGRWAEAHGFNVIVEAVGVRSDESDGREGAFPLTLNRDKSLDGEGRKSRRNWYKLNAIQHLFTDSVAKSLPELGVFGIIAAAGDRWHYAYDLGASRLSCAFCIFAKESEYRLAAEKLPELYGEMVAFEAEIGQTFKPGKTIRDIVGVDPAALLARRHLPVMTGAAPAPPPGPRGLPFGQLGAVIGRNLITGDWSLPLPPETPVVLAPEGMDLTVAGWIAPDATGAWRVHYTDLATGATSQPVGATAPAGSLAGRVALLTTERVTGTTSLPAGALPVAAYFLRAG